MYHGLKKFLFLFSFKKKTHFNLNNKIYQRKSVYFFYICRELPQDPVSGTWYYHGLKKLFLKVVPGTKCSSKIF